MTSKENMSGDTGRKSPDRPEKQRRPVLIRDLLSEGPENARTGRSLANLLGCDIRHITREIERERRQGIPICANCEDGPGYYLASDQEELEAYCKRLERRAGELLITRKALLNKAII